MEKRYQPEKIDDSLYRQWEKIKAFTPKIKKGKTPFSIIMPPPNTNAPLHIGHAMFITLEDILTRFNRMRGIVTLWLPGADHAGILTQVVFERMIIKLGKNRFSLGRKKFFAECLKFTQNNKKIMYNQLKKIGASCDWSREKFTLDPKISLEVLRTFIQLYKDGLAYRGVRLVNWCPRCQTALSDLEVEHQNIKAKLWYIKYPLKTHSTVTGQTMFLLVATTRPETMLGDTAIAVNPQDQRYAQFVGQKVVIPLIEREIPIITDSQVDQEFGSGIVKVTPAHDPLDYQMGLKHKLPMIPVIGFDNKMLDTAGRFANITYWEARKQIVEELNRQNLLIKERSFQHRVAHCERCKTVIEPLLSQQWFIDVNKKIPVKNKKLGLKKASLKDFGELFVKTGKIELVPNRFIPNFLTWMNGLYDWCVSRQIWWGHPLPIYYCGLTGLSTLQKLMNPDLVNKIKSLKLKVKNKEKKLKKLNGCGQVIIALKKPKSCPHCRGKIIIQDPDTFDTWFSSGQWAYTSLGFPKSKDFAYFYPTSVMETGYEILPIWVAKMIMLSLYRTGNIPFKTVYLHGLVRDAFGQKMSKSKGNAINPLESIQKYGADALRFALVIGSAAGNDVSVSEEKIRGYRNFSNKVWNIGRFILLNFQYTRKKIPWYQPTLPGLINQDKAIIHKLNQLIIDTTKNLNELKFSLAGKAIYQFIWHELADKYLESVKPRLKKNDLTCLSVLRHLYLNSLKLLHPYMPFVTEACWQQFPNLKEKYLILSSWPNAKT